MHHNQQHGFSLLELSIVLVIIGLIAGGIVAGASMIRAAELRSVITDVERYKTAVYTFRDKYFGLPGDLKNATAFWGAAHATPATCLTTVGVGTQTCDGDGDNKFLPAGSASEYTERFMFWQHLANAELIAGSYSGIAGSGGENHALETNIPAMKLNGGAWFVYNWNATSTGSTGRFDDTYTTNHLQIQKFTVGGTIEPLLSPAEAWGIDAKIDDKRPAYGQVRERNWSECTNAAASSQLDSEYDLARTDIICQMMFVDVF